MNLFSRLIVSVTLLFGPTQLLFALQPGGQIAPSPSNVETIGTIERGGTINTIDVEKKTMVVDGVRYAFSAAPVRIYSATGKLQEKTFVLKAGMQIRFSTLKGKGLAPDQIREIWVTSLDGKSAR